ncbi:MAG TPA: aldehyde ferredoxin oxidoreductase family protein [Desulfobacterales bacterium]
MIETGKILQIDLSSQNVSVWPISDHLISQFWGGRGLAAALSYRLITEGCEPLGPDNVLTLCNGLLTGTPAPAAARIHFCALSPLTGILGSSNAGGFFGPALRSCFIQGLILTGAADRPVYIEVDPGRVQIRSAAHLWGLDTVQCEKQLKDELDDPRLQVLSIGPAGENRCAMSAIMLGTHSAAGRTGMGAVMGAKRLKAIVVRPSRRATAADSRAAKAGADYLKPIRQTELFKALRIYGQSGYIRWCNEMSMLSAHNYQQSEFDAADRICGSNLEGRILRRHGCFGCPVRCKADTRIATGKYAGERGPRPEFETIAALGAKCGQSDIDAVLHLSQLCNRLGLDTISAGTAVAFAMELFEKKILSLTDTQGLSLQWGDAEAQHRLLEQIARRRGFGALLSDGVRKAAQKIGRGSEAFAFHSKGLELCAYDPRASLSTALSYAVSERGGDFASIFPSAEYRWDAERAQNITGDPRTIDRFNPAGKAALVRRCSICSAVIDALGLCKVVALGIPATFDLQAEARLVNAAMDWQCRPEDLLAVGERILCIERLFNWRHWNDPERGPMDTLPRRFVFEALPRGLAKGRRVAALRRMLDQYYQAMGWDKQGRPQRDRIAALELEAFTTSRFTKDAGYN